MTGLGTVLHLQFKTQRELNKTFVRMQEFYESPYNSIRGCYFTLDQFKSLYTETHGGFSYYTDWHGCNIPGDVVLSFFDVFYKHGDVTDREQRVERIINQIDKPFYMIGTHAGCDPIDDAVTHELCHAMWYLDPTYQAQARRLVDQFCSRYPRTADGLYRHLREQGYCDAVMPDEFNAYLATTELAWWMEHLEPGLARHLYEFGEPFRQLAGVSC